MKKTLEEIQNEIHAFVDALPQVKPEDLLIGEQFVIASEHYHRVFGSNNTARWCVTSRAKTMLKYSVLNNPKCSPATPNILTFKRAARDRLVLRRVAIAKVAEFEKLQDQLAWKERARQARVQNDRDRYVLWNETSEAILSGSLDKFSTAPQRYGFVVEVFNGNGELLDRLRMLSENDNVECALFDATEKMVRAYASQYFDREAIQRGARFQIQNVPEMD